MGGGADGKKRRFQRRFLFNYLILNDIFTLSRA
jgi:hypothetical protein